MGVHFHAMKTNTSMTNHLALKQVFLPTTWCFCLQLVQSHLVIKLLSFTDLLRSWLLMMIQNTNGLTRLELQGHLMRRDRGSLPNFQVSHGITFFDNKALLIQTVRGLKNLAILMGWPDKAFFVEQRNAWVPPRFNLGPKKVAIMNWLYSWHGHIRRDLLNTFNKGWRFNFFWDSESYLKELIEPTVCTDRKVCVCDDKTFKALASLYKKNVFFWPT